MAATTVPISGSVLLWARREAGYSEAGFAEQNFVVPTGVDIGVERWCERFSAAFLLPSDGLSTVARKYGVTTASKTSDPNTARLIANRFSVSTRAMAIRLQELGLADNNLYGAVASQLANRDWNDASGGGGGGQPATEQRISQ